MKFATITKACAATVLACTAALACAQTSQEVAARQVGDFKEGSIKGMPGVLPLNALGNAVLANAPDSQLHQLTSSLFAEFRNAATQPGGVKASSLGTVNVTTLTPLFPAEEDLQAIVKLNDDRKRPLWAQDETDGFPETKDGRYVLKPTPTRIARADLMRMAYRAVQSDVRAAKQYAIVFNTWADRQHLANQQGYAAAGELRMRWADVGEVPDLSADAQVGRCFDLEVRTGSEGTTFVNNEDPKQVCIVFDNLRGVAIPMAVKLRDTSQFKPTDDLRVAVVFTLKTALVESTKYNMKPTAVVTATASYLQIVEANSMQVLGPRIPLDGKSPDISFYQGKDCMVNLRSSRSMQPNISAPKCGLTPEQANAAFK